MNSFGDLMKRFFGKPKEQVQQPTMDEDFYKNPWRFHRDYPDTFNNPDKFVGKHSDYISNVQSERYELGDFTPDHFQQILAHHPNLQERAQSITPAKNNLKRLPFDPVRDKGYTEGRVINTHNSPVVPKEGYGEYKTYLGQDPMTRNITQDLIGKVDSHGDGSEKDSFINHLNTGHYAIISGENPKGLSQRNGHNRMMTDIQRIGVPVRELEGQYGGIPEKSLFIENHRLPKDYFNKYIRKLAKIYGQESFIIGDQGVHNLVESNTGNSMAMAEGHSPTEEADNWSAINFDNDVYKFNIPFNFRKAVNSVPDPLDPNQPIENPDQSIESLHPIFGQMVLTLIKTAKEMFDLDLYIREGFRSRHRQDYLNKRMKMGLDGYAPDIYDDKGTLDLREETYPHGTGCAVDIGIAGYEDVEPRLHLYIHHLFWHLFPELVNPDPIEGDENHYQASDKLLDIASRDLTQSPYAADFIQTYNDPSVKNLDDKQKLQNVLTGNAYLKAYTRQGEMPSSSVVKDIVFDYNKNRLGIDFGTGSQYIYEGVEPEIYESFRDAPSKGNFFNRTIRGKYDFKPVTHEKDNPFKQQQSSGLPMGEILGSDTFSKLGESVKKREEQESLNKFIETQQPAPTSPQEKDEFGRLLNQDYARREAEGKELSAKVRDAQHQKMYDDFKKERMLSPVGDIPRLAPVIPDIFPDVQKRVLDSHAEQQTAYDAEARRRRMLAPANIRGMLAPVSIDERVGQPMGSKLFNPGKPRFEQSQNQALYEQTKQKIEPIDARLNQINNETTQLSKDYSLGNIADQISAKRAERQRAISRQAPGSLGGLFKRETDGLKDLLNIPKDFSNLNKERQTKEDSLAGERESLLTQRNNLIP